MARKPISHSVSKTSKGWVEEKVFVNAGRFKKNAMVSKAGKRSTFLSTSPRRGVRLIVGCLSKDFDTKRGVCLRTTVMKEVKNISKPTAATLAKRKGIRKLRSPGKAPRGTRKGTAKDLKRHNPCVKTSKSKNANPFLAVISNPRRSTKELGKTSRAYKRFHLKKPREVNHGMVPDGYPKSFVTIGALERFDVQKSDGSIVTRRYTGHRPIVCTDSAMKNLFIFGGKKLGIPAGRALRCDYCVAPHSGRAKWSRRWWHAHETFPKVSPHRAGRAVKVAGPGLRVTPRGIEG